MRDTRFWYLSPLAILVLAGLSSVVIGQQAAANQPAYLEVYVPADARLTIDSAKTQQTGTLRRFASPALKPGRQYTYDVKAQWRNRDDKEVTRTRRVDVGANADVTVDFTGSGE